MGAATGAYWCNTYLRRVDSVTFGGGVWLAIASEHLNVRDSGNGLPEAHCSISPFSPSAISRRVRGAHLPLQMECAPMHAAQLYGANTRAGTLERRPSYKQRRPSRVSFEPEYSGSSLQRMYFKGSWEAEVIETSAASARVLARRRRSESDAQPETRRRAVSDSGVGRVVRLMRRVVDADEGCVTIRQKRKVFDSLEGCVGLQVRCVLVCSAVGNGQHANYCCCVTRTGVELTGTPRPFAHLSSGYRHHRAHTDRAFRTVSRAMSFCNP